MAKKKGSETGIIEPFYKKAWFWVVVLVAIAGVGGTFIVQQINQKENAHKIAQKGNSTKTASSSEKKSKEIARSDFDLIKLGDVLDHGKGGDTVAALTKRFGDPFSNLTREGQGGATQILAWSNVDGKFADLIEVTFVNNKVYKKIFLSPKVTSDRKVSLENYNAIKNGMKCSDLIKKVGQPGGYSETRVRGRSSVEVVYSLEDSKNSRAIFEVYLMDGIVTGKNKTA